MDSGPSGRDRPSVAILGDDLIWSTRLRAVVAARGGVPVAARDLDGFAEALHGAGFALVDATARAYDPLEAVRIAGAMGARVICVAQHDDASFRSAARAAGAEKVLAYRVIAERSAAALSEWLEQGGRS